MQVQHPLDTRHTLALIPQHAFDTRETLALVSHPAFHPIHPAAQFGAQSVPVFLCVAKTGAQFGAQPVPVFLCVAKTGVFFPPVPVSSLQGHAVPN